MNARIDRLWPDPAADLDDERILAEYAPPSGPWTRFNFVESLDGAATREGRSGGLGGDGDRRVFELMRRWADVVLVGAGTIRVEGYGALRFDDEAVAWRRARGIAPQPTMAIVSGRLDLDPASAVFTEATTRPLVFTLSTAPADRRAALAEVAEVRDAGDHVLDPTRVRTDLERRGLRHVHAEGGPTLFGSFVAAGALDELCLTLAPRLEAGGAGRIATSVPAEPLAMRLAGILRSGDDELLLRYLRVR
jgi:riboflavin biosynthesis pyrimidine reductase